MRIQQIHRQSGFSLIEVAVTIILVGMLYGVMMEGFGPAIQFRARVETEAKLKSLRTSLLTAYKDHMADVEAEPGQKLVIGPGQEITQQLPGANGRCASASSTFFPVARYLETASTAAHFDGFNQPVCIYITPRQSVTVSGVALTYHSIAVISPNQNNQIDAGTALTAAGELSLGGDDSGVLLDGRAFVQAQFQVTLDALRRTADAYQAYFQARYQADPSRSASVNYFSCGVADCSAAGSSRWDNGGIMSSLGSGSVGVAMDSTTPAGRPYEILGLSQSDVTDGYGGTLQVQNQGDLCRNPSNSNGALSSPPFTAVIYTDLPGGTRVSQTVVGIF